MDTVDDTETEEEIPWHKFMLSSKGRYLIQWVLQIRELQIREFSLI